MTRRCGSHCCNRAILGCVFFVFHISNAGAVRFEPLVATERGGADPKVRVFLEAFEKEVCARGTDSEWQRRVIVVYDAIAYGHALLRRVGRGASEQLDHGSPKAPNITCTRRCTCHFDNFWGHKVHCTCRDPFFA